MEGGELTQFYKFGSLFIPFPLSLTSRMFFVSVMCGMIFSLVCSRSLFLWAQPPAGWAGKGSLEMKNEGLEEKRRWRREETFLVPSSSSSPSPSSFSAVVSSLVLDDL